MSLLETIQSGKQVGRKRVTVLHGGPGTGKTTWASKWPNPLVIQTEKGSEDLDVARTPLIETYAALGQWLDQLIRADSLDFETVVLDTADWVEPMINRDLSNERFDTDFGKGAIETEIRFKRVFDALCHIKDKHDVNVLILSHSQAREITVPEGGSYHQWAPKLSKRANAVLVEGADEILYCTFETIIRTEKGSFNRERGVGVTTGRRVIKLAHDAAYLTKNRLGHEVPKEISMDSVEEYLTLLP